MHVPKGRVVPHIFWRNWDNTFGSSVHGFQMMRPKDFGDPSSTTIRLTCVVTISVPLRMNRNHFGDLLTLHLAPSFGPILWFVTEHMEDRWRSRRLAVIAKC